MSKKVKNKSKKAKETENTKSKKSKEKLDKPEVNKDLLLASIYSNTMDAIEKELQLTSGATTETKLSTGLLVMDLVNDGGLPAGLIITSGPEASGKSTNGWHAIANAVKSVPLILMYNSENALDQNYITRICRKKNISELFGTKDSKGKYITIPKIRYYTSNVLETVFESIQSAMRELPDKVYLRERDEWFLVFKRKKEDIAKMKLMQEKAGLAKHDKELYTQTGKYYCSVGSDDSFQAMVLIDSVVALLPENVDEGSSAGNQMALDAGMLSKYLKRVKGRTQSKRVILYFINQIRLNPGQRFGNPEYEPGGQALKFYSDIRNQLRARANPPPGFSVEEKSVFNPKKKDVYDYKIVKITKNKYGPMLLDGDVWMRVWKSDHKKVGHGFCPVFDTYQYLAHTNQIERIIKKKGTKSKEDSKEKQFKVALLPDIVFTWTTFKLLILAEYFADSSLQKEALATLKIKKLPNLRNKCAKQVKTGEYKNLIVSHVESDADDVNNDPDLDLDEDVEEV